MFAQERKNLDHARQRLRIFREAAGKTHRVVQFDEQFMHRTLRFILEPDMIPLIALSGIKNTHQRVAILEHRKRIRRDMQIISVQHTRQIAA